MSASLIIGDGQARSAQNDADVFSAVFGDNLIILNNDNQMAATIKDNNTVRLQSGIAMIEGRPIQIESGTYDDFQIPTGTAGTATTYYLGYRIYTDSSSKETIEQVVSTTKTAAGSIRDGDASMYAWIYSAYVNGVVLESITRLCNVVGTVSGGLPGVTFGTDDPNDDDGMPDGSLYFKYED